MAISFFCDSCGCHLEVEDSAAGKRASCPDCNSVLAVPQPLKDAASGDAPVVIQVAEESVANRAARFERSVERRGGLPYQIITVFGAVFLMAAFWLLRHMDMGGNFSLHPNRSPLSLKALDEPDSWERVTSDDRKFSVLMPGKPSWNNDRYYGSDVRTADVSDYGADGHRSLRFSTGYLTSKDKSDGSKQRFFDERLDGIRQQSVMMPDANLRDVEQVSAIDSARNVHPGIQFTYDNTIAGDTLVTTERIYIVDDKLVVLEVQASKPYPRELQQHFHTFLNSLEVK